MLLVTLDTNCADNERLVQVLQDVGADIAIARPTDREALGSSLPPKLVAFGRIHDPAPWGEAWFQDLGYGLGPEIEYVDSAGQAKRAVPIHDILKVLSSGAFPSPVPDQLSEGQRRQLRDALILCAHVQHKRDTLISGDLKAFVKSGRRELLERMFSARIRTPDQAIQELEG